MTTESIARELKEVLFSAAIGVEATGRKGQIIWEARGLVNDLIDSLSTPPADDVREALADVQWMEHGGVGQRDEWKRLGYAGAVAVMRALEVRPRGTVTDAEALAKAWDEGVRTAGAYGHEDTWTHDMTPYTENPYRGEARS